MQGLTSSPLCDGRRQNPHKRSQVATAAGRWDSLAAPQDLEGDRGGRHSHAAHHETMMGKMPPQMVTSGTTMKKGVVMAPTTYAHTPEQYSIFCHRLRPGTKTGQ